MGTDQVTYIELYKLKSGLLKQIMELDRLMEKSVPKDFDTLNKLVNDITLGIYDYPFDGFLNEKITFSLRQLKMASLKDIKRYMEIVGDRNLGTEKLDVELKKNVSKLIDDKILTHIKSGTSDIKYRLL